MNKDLLNRIAFDYINENVTMQVLADRYSLSKVCVIRYLGGKMKTTLDADMQEAVDITKARRSLEAKADAGRRGSKGLLIDSARAKELATDMISNGLTIEMELEKNPDVSAGTLFYSLNEENLGPELFGMLQEHYKKNRSNATRNCSSGRKNK